MIREDGYKAVLAGAAEELAFEIFTALMKFKCLVRFKSRKDKEISCPYDRRRNGIIAGEGACMLILEDFEHAKARKAKIYAEIKSYGFCFDPKIVCSSGITADEAAEAIKQAIHESGCSINEIDCIVGSANSTKRFDAIEAEAVKQALEYKAKEIPVTSIKSMIGETFSAGGVFNVAAGVSALEKGFIPPTINYCILDRRCDLNIVANKAVKRN